MNERLNEIRSPTLVLDTLPDLLLAPGSELLQTRQAILDVELNRFEYVDGVGSKFREFLGFAFPSFHSNCGLIHVKPHLVVPTIPRPTLDDQLPECIFYACWFFEVPPALPLRYAGFLDSAVQLPRRPL